MIRCKVPTKKGVPPDREGSLRTYGPNERRASYVNMKNLAERRIRIVRKDAEKTYNVKSLAKGRIRMVREAAEKTYNRCTFVRFFPPMLVWNFCNFYGNDQNLPNFVRFRNENCPCLAPPAGISPLPPLHLSKTVRTFFSRNFASSR